MKRVVARADDIPAGSRLIVDVAGRSVGIFNLGGKFYALRNLCPHAGAPVCRGINVGLVESNLPGHFEYTREGEILQCPWHHWEFDIKTGESVVDPANLRIPSYPAEVTAGGKADVAPPTGVDKDGKPFRLETYPVEVEEALVVIDI